VLDQSRPRVVLAMRQLPFGDPAAGCVDERGPARGRALVEGKNEICCDGPSFDVSGDATGLGRRSGVDDALRAVGRP
jgi:hypothetical protein